MQSTRNIIIAEESDDEELENEELSEEDTPTLSNENKAKLAHILLAGEREAHSFLTKAMLCPYPIFVHLLMNLAADTSQDPIPASYFNPFAIQEQMNAFLSSLLGNACTTAYSGAITYRVGYDTVQISDHGRSRYYTLTLQKPQLQLPNRVMNDADRTQFVDMNIHINGVNPSAVRLGSNLPLLALELDRSYGSRYFDGVFIHNAGLILTFLGIFNYTNAALFLIPGISISGYLLASYLDGSLLASQILESQLTHAAFGLLGVGGFVLIGASIAHIITYQQMKFPARFDFGVDVMAVGVQNFVTTVKALESTAINLSCSHSFAPDSPDNERTLALEFYRFTNITGLVRRPEPVEQR